MAQNGLKIIASRILHKFGSSCAYGNNWIQILDTNSAMKTGTDDRLLYPNFLLRNVISDTIIIKRKVKKTLNPRFLLELIIGYVFSVHAWQVPT
jgi:hypothetical protein